MQQRELQSADNYEKLNKKLVSKIKQFVKLKESRKALKEKNVRFEKKIAIMTAKM